MSPHSARTMEFLNELVQAAGWELRYNNTGFPYAALPRGFGNKESGVKLHFIPNGGSLKVVGVIEFSDKIGIKRPSIYVSVYDDANHAARLIEERLLPRYKEAREKALPLIERWLEKHPEQRKDLP